MLVLPPTASATSFYTTFPTTVPFCTYVALLLFFPHYLHRRQTSRQECCEAGVMQPKLKGGGIQEPARGGSHDEHLSCIAFLCLRSIRLASTHQANL